jgi:predicted transcriptional regulator
VSTASSIGPEVARLMEDGFHSVEELELYVLLRRTKPSRWTADRLGHELGLDEGIVVAALQRLVAKGLAQQPAADSPLKYCYAESTQHPAHLLEALDQLHRENRFDLVTLIARQAIARIRRQAHVAFWSLGTRSRKIVGDP